MDVLKSTHQFSIPFRTSRTQIVRRPLFQRPHVSSPPHKKKPFSLPSRRQRVFSSYKPILKHTDRYAISVKSIYLRLMPAVGSNTRGTLRKPPDGAEELAGKPQSAQLLSGILKSVAVAITLVVTANPPFNRSINLLRETRLGLKLVRAARKQSCTIKVAHVVSSCLASLAFAVFIFYDIRNLAHDEPIDVGVKKTVHEDPAAALASARKELAIMMKGKDVTSDREQRR